MDERLHRISYAHLLFPIWMDVIWQMIPSGNTALSHLVSVLLDFKGTKIRDYCQSKLDNGADPFTIFGELQAWP